MIKTKHRIINQDKLFDKIMLMIIPFDLSLMVSALFSFVFFRDYEEYKYHGYDPDAYPVPHETKLSDVCIDGVILFAALAAILLIIALWIINIRKTERKLKTTLSLILVFLSQFVVFAIAVAIMLLFSVLS